MKKPYMLEMRELVGNRPLFIPGVRAIITDDANRVLLQLRSDMKVWGLPAGSVELGESAYEAMCREVLEETGITVKSAEPMGLYSGAKHKFSYPDGGEVYCFSIAFIVKSWSGQPVADGIEGEEVRFFSPDDLPVEMFPIHRNTIDDFRRYDGHFMLL